MILFLCKIQISMAFANRSGLIMTGRLYSLQHKNRTIIAPVPFCTSLQLGEMQLFSGSDSMGETVSYSYVLC